MIDLYIFMGAHPILTFSLGCLIVQVINIPLKVLVIWMRHRLIIKQGWSPEIIVRPDGSIHLEVKK